MGAMSGVSSGKSVARRLVALQTTRHSSASRNTFWQGAESHAVWSRVYPIVWGDSTGVTFMRARTEGGDVAPGAGSSGDRVVGRSGGRVVGCGRAWSGGRSSLAAFIRAVGARVIDRAS